MTGRPNSVLRTRREESAAGSYATTPGIRSRMQLQRTRDTAPELALRRLLHARGLRYRVDRAPLPGLRRRADIVFGPARVAVYVDGCFWHGCPEHGNPRPAANGWYWPAKIAANKARDADTDQRLRAAGWIVIRTWEHDDPAQTADLVDAAVRHRRRHDPGTSRAGATGS
ncbi:MAG: very short patch repair endonuclease [Pseudonocardiaceae bacterium]